YTPKFIKKAQTITTVSEFSKKDIIHNYNTDADKIQVVYSGVKDIFHPLTNNEQDAIKKKYTEGKEYFIYTGAIQPRKNLINLLKAFSIFKKRQKSEMKLVLAGRLAWKNDAFLDLLKTYKYKADVVLTNYVEEKELAKLTASAYALVYPSLFEGFGVPVLEAMQCNVAVLTSVNSSMQEIAEDAALYFDATNHTDMAEKLMLIYKDESLRSRLIEKGKQVVVNYNWERTANLLWQSVLKAVAARKV
ncbi:MAG TPA: glycosyltransferase family 1 protein, partial [Flavisolibacter sp.]|nr:glycosyltransferase family 1 protein [Flavisolibacter sp.]